MTPVEIFALIVALAAAIKIVVILINPKAWINVVKKVYTNNSLLMIVSLILAAVVLYYLLMEITIIQIFAVMLFLMLLMAMGMAIYKKEIISITPKLLK